LDPIRFRNILHKLRAMHLHMTVSALQR